MDHTRLIDRIFEELDIHSQRLEKLSKIVHTSAASLSIITKFVIAIIIFLVVTSLALIFNTIEDKYSHNDHSNTPSQTSKGESKP